MLPGCPDIVRPIARPFAKRSSPIQSCQKAKGDVLSDYTQAVGSDIGWLYQGRHDDQPSESAGLGAQLPEHRNTRSALIDQIAPRRRQAAMRTRRLRRSVSPADI